MSISGLLWKVDKLLCSYLGIKQEHTRPAEVQIVGETLMITNTASFKRHTVTESWNDYSLIGINQTNLHRREQLGLAAGIAIAKNLVVSFEEFPIKENIKC